MAKKNFIAPIMALFLQIGIMHAHASIWHVGGASPDYATIQAAVDSSSVTSGDTVVVHSGLYGAVQLANGKALIIQEAPGEIAVVKSGDGSVAALNVQGAGVNSSWDGIDIIRDVAGASSQVLYVAAGATHNEIFNLRNCTVSIASADITGASVSTFGERAACQNVTFKRTIGNGSGVVLQDKGAGSIFEKCTFGPMTTNAILMLSGQTTLTLTSCTFTGIAPASYAVFCMSSNAYAISDCSFGTAASHVSAIHIGSGDQTTSATFNVSRTRFYPAPANYNVIMADGGSGASFNFSNCLFISDDIGFGHIIRSAKRAHHWSFNYCTMTQTAKQNYRQFIFLGYGPENGGVGDAANGTYGFQNCIFNWPEGIGWILSAQGGSYLIPASAVKAGTIMCNMGLNSLYPSDDAIGGRIANRVNADPLLAADGYHLTAASPALGIAIPNGVIADIDKDPRPSPAGTRPDLGCDEEITITPPEPSPTPLPPMTTMDGVWESFDPHAEPLEVQIISTWTENNCQFKEFYFTGETWESEKVRVYAIYSAPIGSMNLPGLLHIHGGGQTASAEWLRFWNARGYAAMTLDWCGNWGGRTKYTQWGKITQGNQATSNYYECSNPNQRSNSWYHWTLVSRRALTYLEQQPEVNANKLGIFGISMGGSIVWNFAGTDSRVKAACAIYGVGWNSYSFDTTAPDSYANDANMKIWRETMDPYAYAPKVTCPMLFLDASNDHHGPIDYAYRTLAALPAATVRRQAFTPRQRHNVGPDEGNDLPLFMDKHLKNGVDLPQTPAAGLRRGNSGMLEFVVTPDTTQTVSQVEIYYAIESTVQVSRYWRYAASAKQGSDWIASLPVLHIDKPVFAIANVKYQFGATLTSDLKSAIPADLGVTTATDRPSPMISNFANGLKDAGWVRTTPYTDPCISIVYLQITDGPGGVKSLGFTPACGQYFAINTFKIGDPKWKGAAGAQLIFQVQTNQTNQLEIDVTENDFMPGGRRYVTIMNLNGSPNWQEIRLSPDQFKWDSDHTTPLTNWDKANRLDVQAINGGPWTGPLPLFAQFKWSSSNDAANWDLY